MHTRRQLLLLGGLALAGPSLRAQDARPVLDVPYVPTPPDVVERMLELAQVGAGDLLYDLGCGDGRIVIAAARQRGARGVGIDIDPQRIREARENARKEGVAERATFRVGDLFRNGLARRTLVGVALATVGLATYWGTHIYGKDVLLRAAETRLRGDLLIHTPPEARDEAWKAAAATLKQWEMFGMVLVTAGGGLGLVAFLCERLGSGRGQSLLISAVLLPEMIAPAWPELPTLATTYGHWLDLCLGLGT